MILSIKKIQNYNYQLYFIKYKINKHMTSKHQFENYFKGNLFDGFDLRK